MRKETAAAKRQKRETESERERERERETKEAQSLGGVLGMHIGKKGR